MYDNACIGGGISQQWGNPASTLALPNLKQRLELAVKDAEQRLAEATEARDILNRNPDLERLLNIMQKGRF